MLKNTENKKEYNLAILAPHPVCYQPQLKLLQKIYNDSSINIHFYFGSREGLEKKYL